MIVKYIHVSDPETEKTYDTEKALRNNPFVNLSQKDFDAMELKKFQKDKDAGYILRFQKEETL